MKRYYLYILVGFGAGVLAILIYAGGFFLNQENFFEDTLFSPKPIRESVAIVAIDNESLIRIGQWPWKREIFADFFKKLDASPPKAAGLDVLFSEASRYGGGDDYTLGAAIKNLKFPVILPVEADPLTINSHGYPETPKSIVPLPEITAARSSLGYVNLIPDRDGIVRKTPMLVRDENGATIPSFASRVVKVSGKEPMRRIAFSGRPGSVPQISFYKILESPSAARELQGKYVFIGSTVPDFHDEKLTPVSRGTPMSGVEIHAQIANMLLSNYRLNQLPFYLVAIWIFLAALLPAAAFCFISKTNLALTLGFILGFAHLPLAILLFNSGHIGDIFHVNLAWLLGLGGSFGYRHFSSEREKLEMRKLFSKYVSKDVLEEILRDPSKVRLGGEEKVATVFFSDIRGFTALAEKLAPAELVRFLNRYFTAMTDIALAQGGVVDKYIGDAIMAFWGAPLPNKNHALDAVLASLKMTKALRDFNEENVKNGGLTIDIGIGLNSGPVVVGNMGSDQRFDYTVMGDAVNLASRLEGQTKTYGVHILGSEFTVSKISPEELSKNGIMVREIDQVRVKGKTEPVRVFEIAEQGEKDAVSKILKEFGEFREAYYRGDWQLAVRLGKNISSSAQDSPTQVLLSRAEHFLAEPPQDWRGVYELKTK